MSRLARTGALWRLLAPVRGRLVACAVLAGLGAAAGIVPYVAVAEIGRLMLAGGGDLEGWVAVGALGALLRLLLVFASSRLGHYVDADLLHNLRGRIVDSLGRLPIGWFRAVGTARVKRALTNDLEAMHQLIAHALGEVVAAGVAIALGLGYLATVDGRLALVTAGVLVALAVTYRVAMRSMTIHTDRLVAASTRISSIALEYADGIDVAKTFGRDRLLDRFDDAVEEHTDALRRWVAETRYSSAAARLLSSEATVLAVVVIVGLVMVASDSLTMADLVPFLIVGVGLPTSVTPAIHGAQGVREGRMSAGRVEQLLELPGLPEPVTPRRPRGHDVRFEDVVFSYDGRVTALNGVTATLRAGTITAVVGPSGAGKSTLAALLPRFHDVTSGSIRVGGVDVREVSSANLLALMALVFQDAMLVHDTVAENIRLGRPDADDLEVRAAAEAARVHDVIERLPAGYATVLGEDGGGLSGGERQRLTIARAILSDAPVVVLDEATAALDPDNEAEVQAALGRLTVGRTVLVVAHRLHTVTAVDQILVLDGGELVESGTPGELVDRPNGRYAALWRAQHTPEPHLGSSENMR